MTQEQLEHESISDQVESILKNRFRRFKYLMKKGRVEDAVAVGEEFTEWMLDHEDPILYFTEHELREVLRNF